MRFNHLVRTSLLCLTVLLLSACSIFGGNRKEKLAYVERPAEIIYNEGMSAVDKKDWKKAQLYFEEVERQHPFSEWARRAMLMTAYSSYRAGDYDEAVSSSRRYIELHPGSDSTPYAYYLTAITFFDQIYDVGRDQATTVNAEAALQQVVRRYPESDYARDARLKLELTHDHLAGKEMSIGRYYLKDNQHLAAIGRFNNVVRDYETTSQTEEALYRLVEAYISVGVIDQARLVGSVLGYNYPNSQWYVDCYDLLKDYGIDLDDEISKEHKPGYWRRLRERLF